MSPRALWPIVVALVGLAISSALLHARETRYPPPTDDAGLLYVQSGAAVSRLVLTFDALAADVYWIRAIQHYGRDRRLPTSKPGRFGLLQPLLDLTTTLDPRFNIAYRFGAIFLSIEPPNGPGRPDQALALLQKGLAANPTRWQYTFDSGFIEYWSKNNPRAAADWFERGAAMPSAPAWLGSLAAATRLQGGDRQRAREMLTNLQSSEESFIRQAAERSLRQLDALDEIDRWQIIVNRYAATTHAFPASWDDLRRAGWLGGSAPIDPAGVPLHYAADSHTVELSDASPLAPLPSFMKPK